MKKHILLAVTASIAAANALAGGAVDVTAVPVDTDVQVCDGAPNGTTASNDGLIQFWGGSGQVPASVDPANFTRAGFDIQCSNNVFMYLREESAVSAGVGSASAKGNQRFGGTTAGGAVTSQGSCASVQTGCVGTDASGTLSDLLGALSTGTGAAT